jgi:hypothetical protein
VGRFHCGLWLQGAALQDDIFVGVLNKNILNKLALIGHGRVLAHVAHVIGCVHLNLKSVWIIELE